MVANRTIEKHSIFLIPVVDLSSFLFLEQKYKSSDEESIDLPSLPSEWSRYWQYFLVDVGIEEIEPYSQGSSHIETSKLTAPILEKLLARGMSDDGKKLDFRYLSGGYVFLSDRTEIEPQCCCGFEDIESWAMAIEYQEKSEGMLWIGHPFLTMKSIDERYLQIRTTNGSNEVVPVDRQKLAEAITLAREELSQFKQRLSIAFSYLFPHQSSLEIAESIDKLLL